VIPTNADLFILKVETITNYYWDLSNNIIVEGYGRDLILDCIHPHKTYYLKRQDNFIIVIASSESYQNKKAMTI
jgi:hypothetical protein